MSNDRMPAGLMSSLALHGTAVAVMLLVAYASSFDKKNETKTFELVAGEGDNFGATEAPALGTPDGIKVNVPSVPVPKIEIKPQPEPEPIKPEPIRVVEPEPVKPEPVKPEPKKEAPKPDPKATPAKDAKAAPPKEKTLTDQFRKKAIVEESKIKQRVLREKAAEQKRLDKERADAAKAAKLAAANAPRVDAVGIAKGVVGGSTANKTGGAGGKALTRPDGAVMEAYFSLLKQQLLRNLDKPVAVSDYLVVEMEFRLNADGSFSGVKVIASSGSPEFDRAAIEAFRRLGKMPPRPDKLNEVITMRINTKDLEGN
jgi:colicin import membrane protein